MQIGEIKQIKAQKPFLLAVRGVLRFHIQKESHFYMVTLQTKIKRYQIQKIMIRLENGTDGYMVETVWMPPGRVKQWFARMWCAMSHRSSTMGTASMCCLVAAHRFRFPTGLTVSEVLSMGPVNT